MAPILLYDLIYLVLHFVGKVLGTLWFTTTLSGFASCIKIKKSLYLYIEWSYVLFIIILIHDG